MVKPTWMASIPTSISSTGPKMKSDEWRVAGSLYLPLSLIRLWSSSEDEDLQHVLQMTMHLFSAICIISSRVTSARQADKYRQEMVKYRKKLKSLFPNYKCHPNHHMAFHIHDFIIEYGPVHGWWTFPYERLNGVLQRISTNYHEGKHYSFLSTNTRSHPDGNRRIRNNNRNHLVQTFKSHRVILQSDMSTGDCALPRYVHETRTARCSKCGVCC